MLEFIKLINCFCIKRIINVKVAVGPSVICIISLGSTKQVDVKIMENVNYNLYTKEVLECR